MVKHINTAFLMLIVSLTSVSSADKDMQSGSSITEVKLFQNQAQITRVATVSLKSGSNTVILSGLPPLLYDWSVKGSLPKNYPGKILSFEIEKKALVKKRQQKILEIEKKLENLRERDQILLDSLKNIESQEKFLNSILEFTNQTVSRELATRIPQISVWDKTLSYVADKKNDLLKQKREIEKKREGIGKEIQRWEFELTQIAGESYFRNYQSMNEVILKNRSSLAVQQFADITEKYAKRNALLKKPSEKVEYEKRLILDIYSKQEKNAVIIFSYIIPNTYWQMKYDIRASNEKKSITMVVYGDIYQKTEENWENINLALSTGSPVNVISPPELAAWFLDIYEAYRPPKKKEYAKGDIEDEMTTADKKVAPPMPDEQKERMMDTEVKETGAYVEIALPLKQTILSSNKYQKKFIKEYTFTGDEKVNFYYELMPARVRNGFLKVSIANATKLPWLAGEAQLFLENEFMGKVSIPFTPQGKREDIVLGIESRITATKELVKKYEDSAGLFGGKRRILYTYKIIAQNHLKKKIEVILYDAFPVSRNEKITAEVLNLSLPFMADPEFEKTARYGQGIRKWKLKLAPQDKKEITYEIVISFDKNITIRGLY